MGEPQVNHKASNYGPYEFALGDELRGERATLGKSLLDVQRDLRIKAAYIAAIENAEAEVFPNPGFIAGYVRSYARYLSLDPDEVYHRFCQESGFRGPNAASPAGRKGAADGSARLRPSGAFRPDFPMAELRGGLPAIPFSAIGSLIVLFGLIAGLGYGGWSVLQNIQRVQFAPVDEVPLAIAEMEALAVPEVGAVEPELPELASPVAATALVDLYRQQELEVPILVPRDGPIAAIDPERVGLLARHDRTEVAVADDLEAFGPPPPQSEPPVSADPQVTAAAVRPSVMVMAERAAWIRIYLANGTILFERILERGEVYQVPDDDEVPMIWAGNSGSVYLKVADELRGPIGSGTRAVRDIPLDPQSLSETFTVVAEVPGVLSEAISDLARQADATLTQ
jgi:cytoskeleton protein RodZ